MYDKTKLCKIESGEEFFGLLHELKDDESGFIYNKNVIVERYKDGKLYGLRVEATTEMYGRSAYQEPIFCRDELGPLHYYLLPCFCTCVNNTAELIWVHSRAQGIGLGKTLVKKLKIKKTFRPLESSYPFWEKLNIPHTFTLNEKI